MFYGTGLYRPAYRNYRSRKRVQVIGVNVDPKVDGK